MSTRGVVSGNRVKRLFGRVILCASLSLTFACQQGKEPTSSKNDSRDLTVQPSLPSNNEGVTTTPQKTPREITENQPSPVATPSATTKPQVTASASPDSVGRAPENPKAPTEQSSPESNNSISKALTEKLAPKDASQPNNRESQTETPTQSTSPKPIVQALRKAAKSPARKIAAASNTNVYRSRGLGVNFQYPKGFVIKEPQETSGSSQKVVELWSVKDYKAIAEGRFQNTFSPGNMSISLENNPQGLSLVQWITNNDELGDIIPESYDTKIVAGKEAVSFRTDGLYRFQNVVLPSSDGKNVILISFAEGDRNYKKVFDKVVSSLQVN
ncbi:MAG: hypothetical protein AAFW70_16050 [Cyanobacteria bacterium J06635_10]